MAPRKDPDGEPSGPGARGLDRKRIFESVYELLTDKRHYESMARAVNPYGDGRASERILEVITRWNQGERPWLTADKEFVPPPSVSGNTDSREGHPGFR